MTGTRYQLKDIGRSKWSGEVVVGSERDLLREVKKHLMSHDVGIAWTGDFGTVYAGMRPVGHVLKEGVTQ
jgi:hypothetical protein